MKAPRFTNWFAGLSLLNQPQRRLVQQALLPAAGLDQIVAVIDKIRTPGRCCPCCDGTACHRYGQPNDLQRYRCCACGRTFNDLTGTPLARLRLKGKWLNYCAALLASAPVRQSAERAFASKHRIAHQGATCAPVSGCA